MHKILLETMILSELLNASEVFFSAKIIYEWSVDHTLWPNDLKDSLETLEKDVSFSLTGA